MTNEIKDVTPTASNTQQLISEALNNAYIQGGVEALTNVIPALEQLQIIVAASLDSIKEYIEANKDVTVNAVTAGLTPPTPTEV